MLLKFGNRTKTGALKKCGSTPRGIVLKRIIHLVGLYKSSWSDEEKIPKWNSDDESDFGRWYETKAFQCHVVYIRG